jgi:hypothetical protein
VRTNKHVGQPLVFRREEFLSDYETKILFPPPPEAIPEPVQTAMDFSKDSDTPF